MNIGIIGAGAISGTYLSSIQENFPELNIVAISARNLSNAQKKGREYGIRACETEELLANPKIEMVIVLTPVDSHYSIIKQSLLSGKHVYTEKTITRTTAQAKELMNIAKEKGLYLGAAPDTFLGATYQTARHAIDSGSLGNINSFCISINRDNNILTALFPFLRLPGAGALRDYMVYYLTALVSLLGPISQVSAFIQTPYKRRVNNVPNTLNFNETIDTPNESVISAIVKMQSGIIGTIHQNNESIIVDKADFAILGTKGILTVGCPNFFDSNISMLTPLGYSSITETHLAQIDGYTGNARGIGAAEMARAIQDKRKHRANADIAYHVLEVIEAMEKSSEIGQMVKIDSTCTLPEFLPGKLQE